MTDVYNLTFADNVTSLTTIVRGTNDLSGGWIIGIMVILLWMLFVFRSKENLPKSLTVSSFLMCLIMGAAWGVGMLSSAFIFLPVAGLISGLFLMIWGEK